MKLIVGLGNTGAVYRLTRHNIGFMVADALADSSWKNLNFLSYKKFIRTMLFWQSLKRR